MQLRRIQPGLAVSAHERVVISADPGARNDVFIRDAERPEPLLNMRHDTARDQQIKDPAVPVEQFIEAVPIPEPQIFINHQTAVRMPRQQDQCGIGIDPGGHLFQFRQDFRRQGGIGEILFQVIRAQKSGAARRQFRFRTPPFAPHDQRGRLVHPEFPAEILYVHPRAPTFSDTICRPGPEANVLWR